VGWLLVLKELEEEVVVVGVKHFGREVKVKKGEEVVGSEVAVENEKEGIEKEVHFEMEMGIQGVGIEMEMGIQVEEGIEV
jgi:hypothetical protein